MPQCWSETPGIGRRSSTIPQIVNPIIPKQMQAIPIALRITALYPLSQLLLAGHCTKTSDGVNDGIRNTHLCDWHFCQ